MRVHVLRTEVVDKFVLVTLQHEGLADVRTLRSAALDAVLEAQHPIDVSTERVSGKGAVITFSWQLANVRENV